MKMKTIGLLIVIAIIAFLVIQGFMVLGIAMSKNNVKGKWLEVRNQYKRQADLIPNLIQVTKNYMSFEHQLLLDVIGERAKAFSHTLTSTTDVDTIEAQESQVAQDGLTILVVVESYPDLTSKDVVLTLMDELEGTQNRITVARHRYNDAVISYNNALIWCPLARAFGYSEMDGLEFLDVPEEPPTVPDWDW